MDELEGLLASTQESLTHYIEREVQRKLEVCLCADHCVMCIVPIVYQSKLAVQSGRKFGCEGHTFLVSYNKINNDFFV